MIQPTTLSYQRWLDMYAAPATSFTINFDRAIDSRPAGANNQHEYRLDLSCGSYAVHAHALAAHLTPQRWFDAIRTGSRAAGAAEAAEPAAWELVGAW